MNLPNKLTLLRIFLIPFFLLAFLYENIDATRFHVLIAHCAALAIYVGASITDYFDGLIARRDNLITDFGKLVDPVADKLLVLSAFVCFVELHIFPSWIVILIFAREFLVTGLRAVGASKGRVIQADRWGKYKMGSQTVTIVTALVFMIVRDALMVSGAWSTSADNGYWGTLVWISTLLMILVVLCAMLTVISGVHYLLCNRDLIKE